MLIDGYKLTEEIKEKFKLQYAKSKGPEYLYRRYREITGNRPTQPCSVSIGYLEAFVHHSPYECLRVSWNRNHQHYTLDDWGEEYLYILTIIAAYHLDQGNHKTGILWACKAISLIEYLLPTIDQSKRLQIIRSLPAYDLVCFFPTLLDSLAHYPFRLRWESDKHIFYANDNDILF